MTVMQQFLTRASAEKAEQNSIFCLHYFRQSIRKRGSKNSPWWLMFFQSKCEPVTAWWQRNVEYRYDDALRRYYSGVLALAVQALHDVTDLIFYSTVIPSDNWLGNAQKYRSRNCDNQCSTQHHLFSVVPSWKFAESAGPETRWIPHTVCRKCGAGALQQRQLKFPPASNFPYFPWPLDGRSPLTVVSSARDIFMMYVLMGFRLLPGCARNGPRRSAGRRLPVTLKVSYLL